MSKNKELNKDCSNNNQLLRHVHIMYSIIWVGRNSKLLPQGCIDISLHKIFVKMAPDLM